MCAKCGHLVPGQYDAGIAVEASFAGSTIYPQQVTASTWLSERQSRCRSLERVAAAAGEPYPELLVQRLFEPLGLVNTAFRSSQRDNSR
jgi:hypothetical protein